MKLTIDLQDFGIFESDLLRRVWEEGPSPVYVADLLNDQATADELVAFDQLVLWGLLIQHDDAHAGIGVTVSRIGRSVLDALPCAQAEPCLV